MNFLKFFVKRNEVFKKALSLQNIPRLKLNESINNDY